MNASAVGLSRNGNTGSFTMQPGAGTEVLINVVGTYSDNSKVSDKKTFRIKGIPSPVGTIRGEQGTVKGPKRNCYY